MSLTREIPIIILLNDNSPPEHVVAESVLIANRYMATSIYLA